MSATAFTLALVLLAVLIVPSPATALTISAPSPSTTSHTAFLTVTLTFEDGDNLPIDEVRLHFDCTATGAATDRFTPGGVAIAQSRTTGNAQVTGDVSLQVVHGVRQAAQTGYGYGYDGFGTYTGDRSVLGYGYGYGYGYATGQSNQLTYKFFLLNSAFALNETCTAVLIVDTPLSGDFQSPKSVAFNPRLGGGGGGGGGSSDGNPGTPGNQGPGGDQGAPDSDNDGIPDAVEEFLGTDPNDAESRPSPDWSNHVTLTRVGNGFRVSWTSPGFTPLGFQIWRSTSPYVLVATLPGSATVFEDADVPEHAVYKVTFFTAYTEDGGYYADASRAMAAFGWAEASQGDPVDTHGGSESARGTNPWLIALVAVGLAAMVAVVVLVLRRNK